MKLNLGCSDDIREGWTNVDSHFIRGVNTLTDLSMDWPWEESSIDEIYAADIIEHLPDKIHTMNELYRVLKPGSPVSIIVPTTNGPGAWQDPTHVSYWNRNSFWYFEYNNIYRQRFASAYGIKARFKPVYEKFENGPDGEKLSIVLVAVKE